MAEAGGRRVWYECDRCIGLDLGASTVHGVALSLPLDNDGRRSVLAADVFDWPTDEAQLLDFCRSPHIAIDAPDRLSTGPHLGDMRMRPKFQRGRCAEGALGRRFGMHVPWTTPMQDESIPGWMGAGFELWRLFGSVEEPIEVYPHAVFWRMAGRQLLHKQELLGRRERLAVLSPHIELPLGSAAWSHDSIDALAAAFVAWHHWNGTAEPVHCPADDPWPVHDTSAIWLPPSGTQSHGAADEA